MAQSKKCWDFTHHSNPLGTDLPGVGAGHQPKLETGADTGGVQGLRDPG